MTGTLSTSDCGRRTKRRREELPHAQGQGQKPGGPHVREAAAKRSYPTSKVRAVAKSARLRQRRISREELPHVQGAVAAGAQEGLGELLHVQGQEGWR